MPKSFQDTNSLEILPASYFIDLLIEKTGS